MIGINESRRMGKAQRFKEQRRQDRAAQSVRQTRQRQGRRWSIGLAAFALTAGLLPWADANLAGGALRRAVSQPIDQPSATPANTTPTTTTNPEVPMTTQIMTIQTAKGTITVELNAAKAPKTVAHITDLIKKGFYNGLSFHRVEPGFVIQGGDPKGDGTGGSGQTIKFESNDLKHEAGVIAMARSQSKDSADSQFYVTLAPQPALDGQYVVFGRVTAGFEVVQQIARGDKMTTVTVSN